MKLAHAVMLILLATAIASAVGYFADPDEEAGLRAFAVGMITFVLSSIAAFIAAFVATRHNRFQAGLIVAGLLAIVVVASTLGYFGGAEKEAGAAPS